MGSFSSKPVFNRWRAAFEADPKTWTRYAGRYLWRIDGPDGGNWVLDCGIRPQVKEFEGEATDFEVRLAADDFGALIRGELNPQVAFLERKLQTRGKMKHTLRFNLLLEALLNHMHDTHSVRLGRN